MNACPGQEFGPEDGDAAVALVACALYFCWSFDLVSLDRVCGFYVDEDDWICVTGTDGLAKRKLRQCLNQLHLEPLSPGDRLALLGGSRLP
ncbi:MAG TPA: hypothetical protein VMI31_10090 [Fimbriimonadaceae bacterium]|nr:hypothetical protein [Fimbriimonadaceae bacterium]